MQEDTVQSLSQEDPLKENMEPTPVFSPGKSHGLRILVGYSPWSRKESDITERLHLGLYSPAKTEAMWFPSPGDLPDPGIKPGSPALQADALPSEPPGKLSGFPNNCSTFNHL